MDFKRINQCFKAECSAAKPLIAVELAYQTPFPFAECFYLLQNIFFRKSLFDLKHAAEKISVADGVIFNK